MAPSRAPGLDTDRTGATPQTSTSSHSGSKSGLLYAQTAGAATLTQDAPLVDQTAKGTTYTANISVGANCTVTCPRTSR